MNIEVLKQTGLSELQAKIYLHLVKYGQQTPSEIARKINEKRTTVYSALDKLIKLGIITQKNKGKISAFVPNHPSALESLAEKRLRNVARQVRNLEGSLPSLINYYNEHQNEPGVTTFYGVEGIKIIWNKILLTKETYYFVRSRHDSSADKKALEEFKKARAKAKIKSEDITPAEFTHNTNKKMKNDFMLTRTLLPPGEYDSPVEIDIFGNNIAFINYEKDGMSTLIESPEIAEAMRQFFLFAKKYIRKATDQNELDKTTDD